MLCFCAKLHMNVLSICVKATYELCLCAKLHMNVFFVCKVTYECSVLYKVTYESTIFVQSCILMFCFLRQHFYVALHQSDNDP